VRREYPKVSGRGRRTVVTLLVLGAVVAAADFGTRALAEARLAAGMRDSLGLAEAPELELAGFPFLLQVARGRLERVSMDLPDVTLDGLRFDRVTLSLEDLDFDGLELLGGAGEVAVGGGRAEAVLSQDTVSAYLQDRGTPVLVRLPGPGVRVSTRISHGGDTTTATAEGRIGVEEATLVFSPDRVDIEGSVGVPAAALAFEVPLPDVVRGMRYETVSVHDGIAAIEASVDEARLDLGT
jgi:hypothetical protein